MPTAITNHAEHAETPASAQSAAQSIDMQAAGRAQYREVWPYCRPFWARYGVAILVVLIAFALRYTVFGPKDHSFPFLFFVPAAMVAAWYGGLGPGLFATAVGLMLGDAFFLHDHKALGSVREAERIGIGLYALTTILCVMLFEQLHEQIRKLEHKLHKPDDDTSA